MSRQIAEPNLGPPPPDYVDPDFSPPEDRTVVGELQEDEEQQSEEEVTELTDDERALFQSLLTVGQRTKTINVFDHSVEIQSLRVSDDLRISLYTKKYEESRGLARSYQLAVCAAGIRSIDGQPIFQPLSHTATEDEAFDKKVEYLKDFYPIVINQIYNEIIGLDTEFMEFCEKLGKLNG